MRDNIKKNKLVCMLYYGTMAMLIQYQKPLLQKFMIALKTETDWKGKLPYEFRDDYKFIDRQKHQKRLCIVLAGYKPALWEVVFYRLKRFAPADLDVCILVSGCHKSEIIEYCKENGWSYLSTKKNKLTRIQNLAIYLHPCAEYIYKLDEDIFITENFFDSLSQTFQQAKQELSYKIAYVAPLIPVNGYGYVRVLKKCDLISDWENRFGPAIHTDCKHHHTEIYMNSGAAKYMWGENCPQLSSIDRLANRLSRDDPSYSICPIRFSIGAYMFKRSTWIEWGAFPVDFRIGLGLDEEHLAHFCMFHGNIAIVDENTLVGHLAYGPQTKDMISYFENNKEIFEVKEYEK